ncbi:MAG: DUF4386 domain-containing protein [Chloroflexi bacterium]|nr:DUF4386 domain-containing protein [Chloroflexota bacterium]
MKESKVNSNRKTAVVAGIFFLLTEITAIGAIFLYGAVVSDPNYIVTGSAGGDNGVFWGALFELLLAVANVGTAVTLFPVVKRQNESIALGYVCGRLAEGLVIIVGILSLLAVVTLRQDLGGAAGTNAASLGTVGTALVGIHNWTFLFGPNLILGLNTLMLAYLMYRSKLVPRFIAVLGLAGGSLIFISGTAVMFGLYTQGSTVGLIAGLPVFAWEVSLALWLIFKGFNSSAIASYSAKTQSNELLSAAQTA